jgi:hypothetical protein
MWFSSNFPPSWGELLFEGLKYAPDKAKVPCFSAKAAYMVAVILGLPQRSEKIRFLYFWISADLIWKGFIAGSTSMNGSA